MKTIIEYRFEESYNKLELELVRDLIFTIAFKNLFLNFEPKLCLEIPAYEPCKSHIRSE